MITNPQLASHIGHQKIEYLHFTHNAQKMKFSIEDFFNKYEQICSFLRICSHYERNP